MYSVIRFCGPVSSLKAIDSQLVQLASACFERFQERDSFDEQYFSVSVSRSQSWDDHVRDMVAVLKQLRPILRYSITHDVTLELDLGINPEDYEQSACKSFTFSSELLALIVECGAALTASIYCARYEVRLNRTDDASRT